MCGICGVFNSTGGEVPVEWLRGMVDALAHRGPDGEGFYRGVAIGLGHRRLAILDPSPLGAQPMSYGDGRYWITYNGEIYNFLELRAELEAKGHVFRTNSDTEVILAAYAEWGRSCLYKFNGMWAFAIWDSRCHTLFLARDRFGIKPLYFYVEAERFTFASEMKAFLHLPGFRPQVDWACFKAQLLDSESQEGGERCLFLGVRRLLPGHYAIVTPENLRIHRWWDTLEHLVDPPAQFAAQADEFMNLFEDACRLRMRSDVPIGTCLSGGLDSSSVVATLARIARHDSDQLRLARDWQRAFIATFAGTHLDESKYAETIVHATGVTPVWHAVQADDCLNDLGRIVYHLEDLATSPLSGLWSIYQTARQHGVVVTLDGHGSDELLGGYLKLMAAALQDAGRITRSPVRYWSLLGSYLSMFEDDIHRVPSRWEVVRDSLQWAQHPLNIWRRLVGQSPPLASGDGVAAWLTPDFHSMPSPPQTPGIHQASSRLGWSLYHVFHNTTLPHILHNFDRMSMAHGVEVRMPFMDYRLVTYTFSLPDESKVGGGYTKRILREAMGGLVPDSIRLRRGKVGFNVPLDHWFGGTLRSWVEDVVGSRAFVESDIWDGQAIRAFVTQTSARDAWTYADAVRVWRTLHAHLWLTIFAGTVNEPLVGSSVNSGISTTAASGNATDVIAGGAG